MELKDFIGEHILTGVYLGSFEIEEGYNKGCICNSVDFIIDGNTYTAIEDPDDGYRSSLKEIVCDNSRVVNNIFSPVKVVCAWMPNGKYYEHQVLDFIDVITGKIVLSVGTENVDDYYPAFVSRFHPENMILNINKEINSVI